ncbi:hypothetical protein ES703_49103 [subsurface metagenome]
MMNGFIKDMAKYTPGHIVPAIVGIVSIPVITRLLSPGEYGNYALVMATVGVLSTTVGWLSMSIIRFYPVCQRDKKLDEFYGTVIKLTIVSTLAVSLIASGALVVLKPSISMKLYSLLWIGILVSILMSGLGVPLDFLRAKRRVAHYSAFRVWNNVAAIGLGVLLVTTFRSGVSGLLWGWVLGMSIVFPFTWKKAMEGVSSSLKGISFPLTFEMVKYSFPLVAGNLAAWTLSLSDRYILEFFRGSSEVGIYSASYGICEKAIMLPATLFMLASWPIAMNTWEKEGEKKSQEFVSQLTRYYLIIGLPAMVGLSVLAKPLVEILIRQEYYEGYRAIPLVTSGVFLFGLQQRFQAGPIFHKRTYLIMLSIVAAGLFNLGFNLLLIPQYGYMAAAFTTLISYVFLMFLMIIVSRRFFVWQFPVKSLAKATCASLLMGLIVYYIGSGLTSSGLLNLALGIVVGSAVYSLTLFLFQEFKPAEIEALLDLKSGVSRRVRSVNIRLNAVLRR